MTFYKYKKTNLLALLVVFQPARILSCRGKTTALAASKAIPLQELDINLKPVAQLLASVTHSGTLLPVGMDFHLGGVHTPAQLSPPRLPTCLEYRPRRSCAEPCTTERSIEAVSPSPSVHTEPNSSLQLAARHVQPATLSPDPAATFSNVSTASKLSPSSPPLLAQKLHQRIRFYSSRNHFPQELLPRKHKHTCTLSYNYACPRSLDLSYNYRLYIFIKLLQK